MGMKPIVLYGHASGPNPWKVDSLCRELDIPFETTYMDMADLKKPPFEAKNPNGRVPAIYDPNTDLTLFESGAILEYLTEQYDTEHKLSYDSFKEKWMTRAWLYFQVSGQGPYFGQLAWFQNFHPEKVPSAEERYANEVKRVVGVIDRYLKEKKTDYLVGDKYTYADLAFWPWNGGAVGWLLPNVDFKKDFPDFVAWHERINARPAVVASQAEKAKRMNH